MSTQHPFGHTHTQTGYQSSQLPETDDYPGYNIAILHGTVVVEHSIEGGWFTLNTGGWPTRATAKAMNGALQDFGLKPGVKMRENQLFYGDVKIDPKGTVFWG